MKAIRSWLSSFRRLKWALTLSYTLITLAAILMVGWWSIIAIYINLFANNTNPTIIQLRGEIINVLFSALWPSVFILIIPAALVGTLFGFLTARWLDGRLNRLAEATEAWGNGNFAARIPEDLQDEIGELSHRLNQMAAELETLFETRQELAGLEERNRIARDLHDAVKQNLTASGMQIAAAQSIMERDPAAAANFLSKAAELSRNAQQELSEIIYELRPAVFSQEGLPGALRTLVNQWTRQTNISVKLEIPDHPLLDFNTELAIYRVIQEALSNIARHSGASLVTIRLISQPELTLLEINDNGKGFNPDAAGKGFGLQNIHERINALNGDVVINSSREIGTQIVVKVPNRG